MRLLSWREARAYGHVLLISLGVGLLSYLIGGQKLPEDRLLAALQAALTWGFTLGVIIRVSTLFTLSFVRVMLLGVTLGALVGLTLTATRALSPGPLAALPTLAFLGTAYVLISAVHTFRVRGEQP